MQNIFFVFYFVLSEIRLHLCFETDFMAKLIDLTNKKYGKLTVIRICDKNQKYSGSWWHCKCTCGNYKDVHGKALREGGTKSCGCYQKECTSKRSLIHGNSYGDNNKPTPEYRAWQNIKKRCHNPKNKSFPYYGGRGIIMCERWRNDFTLFLQDVGKRPSSKHSLDRFPNNNGNYEPNNFRWATREEQGHNMRNNKYLFFKGNKMLVSEFSKLINVWHSQIIYHMKKGKSTEDIFNHFEKIKSRKNANRI